MSSIFYGHNVKKLEINNVRKAGKLTDTWKSNHTLLYNEWIKGEILKKSYHVIQQFYFWLYIQRK